MNSTLRKVLLGVAVILFVAFIWHRSSTPDAPQDPLLREVQWKRGTVGNLWNEVHLRLPLWWQKQLPISSEPDWLGATDWLSQYANDPEVARSIVQTWPNWNPEAKQLWLYRIQDRHQKLSSDYLPLARSELAPDALFGQHLLTTLARFQPLPRSDVDLIVHFLEHQFPDLLPEEQILLLSQLATLDSLPREVLTVLATLPEKSGSEVALIARVALAQVAPAEFPLGANTEARLRQLSYDKQLQLLGALRAPEFQRGETPAWSLARLADLVRSHQTNGTANVQELEQLFAFLEEVGPSGAALALDVTPWITAEYWEVRDPAAAALTQLSPPTPELLKALLPHLAFDSATVTLLAWLAAHPAQSQAAEPVIARLCQGQAPRQTAASAPPDRSEPLDPSKARRGRRAMRPEGLLLECRPKSISFALFPGWPGYRSYFQETAASIPQTNSTRFQLVLESRLPEVTFRELAEHCLAEIRAARNTPTNHPASPSGSDH